jgi:phage tail protein X
MASWLFKTPVVNEGPASWEDPLFLRVKLARGITVLNNGGAYTAVRFPTQDEIAAATAAYMGGHEYTVTDAVKAALLAANVGVAESNFTLVS